MISMFKKHYQPIGIDMGDDTIKLVQVENNGRGVVLIEGCSEKRPGEVKPGSSGWQRWALDVIGGQTSKGKFKGKNVVVAIPASEVFIDHIKKPKVSEDKIQSAIFSRIKQKLSFDPTNAMIKYIPSEDDNIIVIVAERAKIDRHLAIYEKANLHITSMCVWPTALLNSYINFFGRRKSDEQVVVMLLDIESNCTNVVICRHRNLLYARSIPIGINMLENNSEGMQRLILELKGCIQQHSILHKKSHIERVIFLSGQSVDKVVCASIAKQLDKPAQMADCLAAVKIDNPEESGIERRECNFSWATAFGLSLS